MKGEKEFSEAVENDLYQISADKDSLYGVNPLRRILIAFGGPLFNIILTWLCFLVIATVGYTYFSASSEIRLANEVYPGTKSAAAEAGLLSGDIITEIDGNKIEDFSDIVKYVSLNPDKDLNVKVIRDSVPIIFTVHSDMDIETGSGKIGIVNIPETSVMKQSKTYGFPECFIQAFKETWFMLKAIFKGISGLFKGVKITKAVTGPASITKMLGDTVNMSFSLSLKNGLSNLLNFIALISLSLFIMNLLPIPVLDGGLIFISLFEIMFRKSISPKTRYRIQYIGFAFIAFFLIIAVIGDYNFFMRLLHEK